jgi:DNA-binding MarR family transcriptional regulator
MNSTSNLVASSAVKKQGCINLRPRQLMRRMAQHYDLEMAKAGLKTTQYSLHSHALNLHPLRPGDLARSMKMSASTLTRNLNPLNDVGWIEFAASSDPCSCSGVITPAGSAKREEARQHWKAAQDSLNHLLGVGRVLALHELINESLELLTPAQADTGADDE